MSQIQQKRRQLVVKLYPKGVPKLFCPLLTHYNTDGSIDFTRMSLHINSLHPYVTSFLVPGSTGDGWELSFEQYTELMTFWLEKYKQGIPFALLVGLLQTKPEAIERNMEYFISICAKNKVDITLSGGEDSFFKGFVLCAPKGKDVTSEQMQLHLEAFLTKDYPFILYQLPQVTQNNISPELVSYFAHTYPNFYMMKDSGGEDRVVTASMDYQEVLFVRGAEGSYCKWLKQNGGSYDGFLLSTANVFARELSQMITRIGNHQNREAADISARITQATTSIFGYAAELPFGNPFTNSNKLIDHINAYGSPWKRHTFPRSHSGHVFEESLLEKTEKALKHNTLFPKRGYCPM